MQARAQDLHSAHTGSSYSSQVHVIHEHPEFRSNVRLHYISSIYWNDDDGDDDEMTMTITGCWDDDDGDDNDDDDDVGLFCDAWTPGSVCDALARLLCPLDQCQSMSARARDSKKGTSTLEE